MKRRSFGFVRGGRAPRLLFLFILTLCLTLALASCSDAQTDAQNKPCEHAYGEWSVVTDGGCTGETVRVRVCTLCSEEQRATLIAKGHSPLTVAETAPTCEEAGLSSYTKCKDCGVTLSEPSTIPPVGHTPTVTRGTAPTCESAGVSDATYCSTCNQTLVAAQTLDPLPHTPVTYEGVAPSCLSGGFSDGEWCEVCHKIFVDRESLPAKGHSPVVEAGKAPSCLEAGYTESSYCGVCQEVLSSRETIGPLGHVHTVVSGYASTCTEAGLSDGAKCSRCNLVLEAQQTLPLARHNSVTVPGRAATCGVEGLTEGSQCADCGTVTLAQQTIPALTHIYEIVQGYAPTCKQSGLTDGMKCKHCGTFSEPQQEIPKEEHDFTTEEYIPPSCDASGFLKRSCTNCNEKKGEIIPASGHTSVPDEGRPATTEQTGLSDGAHCSTCQKVLVAQKVTPRLVIYTVSVSDVRLGSVNLSTKVMTPGEKIDLLATPAEGCGFLGWFYTNGQCASNSLSVSLDVHDPDKDFGAFNTIEARFYRKVALSVSPSHDGPEILGEGYYDEGERVTLSVNLDALHRLDGWYVDGVRVSSTNAYSFVMGASAPVIELRFIEARRLQILYDEQLGTVTATNLIEGGYAFPDTEIYLKATADAAASFVGFYQGQTLMSAQSTLRFTMPNEDVMIEATFVGREFTLHALSNTQGVTLTGSGSYKYGETVTISASMPEGMTFVGWLDTASQTTVSTDLTYTFTMPSRDMTIYAVYEELTFRITVFTPYDEIVIPSPDRDFRYGAKYTLMAPPVNGYEFLGWFVNGEKLGNNYSYEITVQSDIRATAKYAKYYGVYPSVNLEGVAEIEAPARAYAGSSILLQAEPYGTDYYFHGWFVDDILVCSDLAYNAIMPEGDLRIEARFERLYKITIVENKIGGGTYRVPETALAGQQVTLRLSATNSGYRFLQWYIDDEHNTSEREYTFTMPEHDLTVQLIYRKLVKVSVTSNYEGAAYSYHLPEYEGESGWIEIVNQLDESLRFDGFFINGELVESGTHYEFVIGEEDVEIVLMYTEFFFLNVWSETKPFEAHVESEWNAAGTTVKIFADELDNDHVFRGWYTGNMECISTEREFFFEMPAETKYIYCVYDELHTVTVTTNAPSALVASGVYRIANGNSFYLVAEERIGNEYLFDGWYADGERVSSALEYNFFIHSDVTIEARYYKKYSLEITHSDDVSVTGEGKYLPGDMVTVSASTENTSLSFCGWSDGEQIVARDIEYTFFMPAHDVTLHAVFVLPWDGTIADGFDGGDGSEENPYLIRTAEQLAFLANAINSTSNNSYYDKHYRLVADIDLGGREWTPIGIYSTNSGVIYSKAFAGSFDGNGFEISNFKITKSEFSINSSRTWGTYVGLFGFVMGDIRSLSVRNFDITLSVFDSCAVGGLAGEINGGSAVGCSAFGTIIVTNQMQNKSNASVGLLLGRLQGGTVTDSSAFGKITIRSFHSASAIRTAAGTLIGSCWNKDDVGFVVADCHTNANISVENGSGSYTHIAIGGFIGEAYQKGDIMRCTASGNVTVKENGTAAYVGGFIGYISNTNQRSIIIKDAYAQNVTLTVEDSSFGSLYVGGFVGEACGLGGTTATVSASYATGSISVKGTAPTCYVGGFVGLVDYALLQSCLSMVDTTVEISSAKVGPFAGGVKNTSYISARNWYVAEGYTTSGGTVNDKYKLVTTENLTEEFFVEELGFDPEIWVTEYVYLGVYPYLR